MTITIQEQIRCVEDEIQMRHRVYFRLVLNGKMTPEQKEKKIATMEAVRDTLILAERMHILKPFNQPQEKNNG